MADSKKLSFSTTAKSWAIFAKILQIGPWVSRINWCERHSFCSTYMIVRLSNVMYNFQMKFSISVHCETGNSQTGNVELFIRSAPSRHKLGEFNKFKSTVVLEERIATWIDFDFGRISDHTQTCSRTFWWSSSSYYR